MSQRWKWGKITLSSLPSWQEEEESLKAAASDPGQVSGPLQEEAERTPLCHEGNESTPDSISCASVEETPSVSRLPEGGDDPLGREEDHWINITPMPPKKSKVSKIEAQPRSGITIWQVQATYVEGDYPQQWQLRIPAGAFPFPAGTFLIYNGKHYMVDRQIGETALKVFAFSGACSREDDPSDFLASFVPLTAKCHKRRTKGKVNILANTRITPLPEVDRWARRAFEKREPHYLYQVSTQALPEDLSVWLPEGTRLCYVKFDERAWDTGFFAKVAATPKEMQSAHRIELFAHDALTLATLLAERAARVPDIRLLPVYFLPEWMRRKVSSDLSFLPKLISSQGPERGRGERSSGDSTCSSALGELERDQLARIKRWAHSEQAPLFDYAAIRETGLENEWGERKVEIAVFANRLLGKQSGPVYECWLSPNVINWALPWTPSFESQESHTRRVQVTAYALAHGGRQANAQEIEMALPLKRTQEEEEPVYQVSVNIPLDAGDIKHLSEELEPFHLFFSEQRKRKRSQAALLTLAGQTLKEQLARGVGEEGDIRVSRALLEAVEELVAWFNCEQRPPHLLAIAPSVKEQQHARAVLVTRYDNPRSVSSYEGKRQEISREVLMRTEVKHIPNGYELVFGIPKTLDVPGTIDLDLICQKTQEVKQEYLPRKREQRAPLRLAKKSVALRQYTVTRRRATEAELAVLATK